MIKVLVVEDEPTILENIIETLELEGGYEILGAQNGIHGLEMLSNFTPDLILCDIMMPKMDGYSFLMQVRQIPNLMSIPFIFLTAKSSRSDVRTGMNLGADDYLSKPFTPEELLDMIHSRMQLHEQRTQEYERKLNDLRTSLIHALPHEFRTPLTGILGYATVMQEDVHLFEDQPETAQRMINAIMRSGIRLQELIENYLLFTQLELIKDDETKSANFRQGCTKESHLVVERAAQGIAQKFENQHRLHLDLTPSAVQIEDENLAKIVKELVSNAYKFSDAETPISVHTQKNGEWFQLLVTNTGRGMTEEEIASIDAYMQFQRRIYEQQGMGLGLIICRRIAELHHGALDVASTPGEETTVSVTLRSTDTC